MEKHPVQIQLDISPEEFRKRAETEPIKAAESLSSEIQSFNRWVMDRGMDPLTKLEVQILREYLGYKLVS